MNDSAVRMRAFRLDMPPSTPHDIRVYDALDSFAQFCNAWRRTDELEFISDYVIVWLLRGDGFAEARAPFDYAQFAVAMALMRERWRADPRRWIGKAQIATRGGRIPNEYVHPLGVGPSTFGYLARCKASERENLANHFLSDPATLRVFFTR